MWKALIGIHIALLCPATAKDPGAAVFEKSCVACHGRKAGGNAELKAPPLAGLPVWYTTSQLTRYFKGLRGSHPEDIFGLQMAAIAEGLTQAQIKDLATYLAAIPPIKRPLPKGDPVRGKELYLERCAECHRFDASGEITFGSAPLARFPPWYLKLQFGKFKSGQRGYLPADSIGAKMKGIASATISKSELNDVISYISECK
ncbi:c-type cytochrome [Luteolibacter sp. AS25]|uniref:c-type cytochrome n=1 Tax=Luteolibacter sp. AS25 TaxID=3135776 RepID=UPI00398A81EE